MLTDAHTLTHTHTHTHTHIHTYYDSSSAQSTVATGINFFFLSDISVLNLRNLTATGLSLNMMSSFPLLHETNMSLLSLKKSYCVCSCVNLGEFLDSFQVRGKQQHGL
jgi:hypothetical protein